MDKVFVDTDVILDFLLDRAPQAEYASQLFSMGDEGLIKLCTSGLVFSNCYYVLRKLAAHKEVIQKLQLISTFLAIIPVTKSEVLDALYSPFNDFEDAIQNAAAVNAGMQFLLTRNTKDYKRSELPVMSPEEYLKT